MSCWRRVVGIGAVSLGMIGQPVLAQDASRLPFQKSDPQARSGDLKPGANSFMESQVRQLLESKGYSDVSTLVNDPNGIWRGTAKKNDRQVDVSIDYQGHVAEK